MLEPNACRRDRWTQGNPVTLADGQEWTFPKPRIQIKPKFVDGKVDVDFRHTFGPEYDETMDIIYGVVESEPIERLRAKFDMAVRLLRANYDLTDDQVSNLLVMDHGEPASDERWEQITTALLGLSPKEVTPDGSESPASSPE